MSRDSGEQGKAREEAGRVEEPKSPNAMDFDDEEVVADPEQEAQHVALVANALPSVSAKKRNFRLTKDWQNWPSAGQLSNEVTNGQQARYGILTDTVFETLKVSDNKIFRQMSYLIKSLG